ncbi:hypothetical protein [Chromobacterium vaccinii]|uniref:hypothetical protein n=1 Tax=Chromobacterium vaccinii TaxID=1108595 RepID=UPI001E63C8A0|nr:hypothetical protein [Chromobacterium vaccinii]MCD4499855.1 hypothetical protein [Chromobacterium vaccinii]
MKSKLAAQRTNFPRTMLLSLRAMRAILTRKSDDSQQAYLSWRLHFLLPRSENIYSDQHENRICAQKNLLMNYPGAS